MSRFIQLNSAEIQSGLNRVKHAEGLIKQLPANHHGRNAWLLNYGVGDEAKALRDKHDLNWQAATTSAEIITSSNIAMQRVW